MKIFFRICIALAVLLFAAGFFLRSVPSAFAERPEAEEPPGKILWINIDSVDAHYKAFTDLGEDANTKYKVRLQNYQDSAISLQQRYDLLQQRVQMGTISSDEAAQEELAINNGMERLKKAEADIAAMQEKAMKINAEITEDVQDYLKEYSAKHHADYVLGYGGSSNVLYANDKLDVTKEVVRDLNARYKARKKK